MKSKVKSVKYYIISLVLMFAVMAVIFYLSAQEASESEIVSGFFVKLFEALFKTSITDEFIRTAAHFSEYVLLAFLTANVFNARFSAVKFPLPVVCAWGYAWTDEIHQIFVDGRAFQFSDLAVDLSGTVLGTVAFIVILNVIKKLKRMKQSRNK